MSQKCHGTKVRNGLAYLTSYTGGRVKGGRPELFVHFKFSEDGRTGFCRRA